MATSMLHYPMYPAHPQRVVGRSYVERCPPHPRLAATLATRRWWMPSSYCDHGQIAKCTWSLAAKAS